MRAAIKITFFDDNDEKFFGEGPYRLLLAIEKPVLSAQHPSPWVLPTAKHSA